MGVPIQVVLTVIISIVAAVSVIVAFVPTYLEGLKATRSTMDDLKNGFIARTQDGAQNYFQTPWTVLTELENSFDTGVSSTANRQRIINMLYAIALRHNTTLSSAGFIDFLGPVPWISVDIRWLDTNGPLYLQMNLSHISVHPFIPRTSIPFMGVTIVSFPNTGGVSPVGISVAMNPNATVRWSMTSIGYNSPRKDAYFTVRMGGVPIGALLLSVTPGNLNTFLAGLGLRARASACIVDAQPGLEVDAGVLMANSWGENVTDLSPLYEALSLPDWMRMRMKYLHNISNPRMEEAVAEIGQSNLLTGSLPIATSYGSGKKKTFVDVVGVSQPGLEMRVILVMPEIDFLEEVYKTQTNTIIIVVCLFVLMVIVAAVVGYLMTVPLNDLEERMMETASLRDESTDTPESAFSEVASLQRAYYQMRFELNRLKSYVPQSVLYVNDDDEEEGDELEASQMSAGDGSVGSGSGAPSGRRSSGARRQSCAQSGTSGGSRRSDTASSRRGGGAASKGLNLSTEVMTKRVTAVVFNLSGFHGIGAAGSAKLSTHQTSLLTAVSKFTRENKGVIDFFQGDHILCTFNAVGNTAAHAKRATFTALAVQKELKSLPDGVRLTCGISSGMAHVGNMGTDGMRRFNVIGPVIPQAFFLERLNKLYGRQTSVLVHGSILEEIGLETYYQTVDIVKLPCANAPARVASVLTQKAVGGDEWMYELEEGAAKDPYANVNKGFDALLDGSRESAEKLLAASLATQTKADESRPAEFGESQLRSLLDENSHIRNLGPLQAAFSV